MVTIELTDGAYEILEQDMESIRNHEPFKSVEDYLNYLYGSDDEE